jgi:methylaspartate mutase epsilon subunit
MSSDNFNSNFLERRRNIRKHPYLIEQSDNTSQEILSNLSDKRFAFDAYKKRGPLPLIQPRGGYALWDKQRDLSLALSKAGADFIPLTIDSHTRLNQYEVAHTLLNKSIASGENLLNGYPLLAHGANSTRALFTDINKPISLRHGTPDARILVEAALDSGITEIEGGGLCYSIPYSRNYPIDRALLNWQYVDRLCAHLSTEKRPIHRESFGVLTATMVPPIMVVVVEILELLLASEQGVSSFAVSFAQTGSMIQDLATAKALRSVASKKLQEFGFNTDVKLVFHQWMGAFPHDRVRSESLISQGSIIAVLSQSDKIVIKTRAEALGIPDQESNADAVVTTKYSMELCAGAHTIVGGEVFEESKSIEKAANYLLDAILNINNMPLWDRVAKAVRKGFIDIPFSPHQDNFNKMWCRRDSQKAIRISDPGQVLLPKEFLSMEKRKLGNISKNQSINSMIDDIMIMSR